MKKNLLVITLLTATLSACAGMKDEGPANADTECARNQGLERGSAQYRQCVHNYVIAQCKAQGFKSGTPEFGQCVDDMEKATFTRQQLDIRGY